MAMPMPGTLRGFAIALTAASVACAPGPSGPPPEHDPLWIAVVRTDGVLIPFARHGDDGWDLPWPAPFEAETAALDTGGDVVPPPWLGREAWTLPVPPIDRQDPGGGRIAAPLQWSFYSRTEQGTALAVSRLLLVEAHCMMSWGLGLGEPSGSGERGLPRVEGTPDVAGVAFNHPLDVVSAEEEIPGLDRIRADLDLIDVSGLDDPMESRRFVWLGFYRLDDGDIIGVVNDRLYEGESWFVLEIDGDEGRIAHRVYGGGC